ncbi:hypothetical protein J1614_003865 [Plenodomus biglobosus]|nr:hypothetical protein J1614_003865 [Plenodomus biglobosus]
MSDPSNLDHSSEVVVGRAEGSVNPLNTPCSAMCFSPLVSDSAHSYLDFDLPDGMIPGTNQVPFIVDWKLEPGQQINSFENQIPYCTSRNETPMLDWPRLGRDQNLNQDSAAVFCDFLEAEQDHSAAKCTLALFSERIVADKSEVNNLFLFIDHTSLITYTAQTKPLLTHKSYRITALFQNADRESRRQQTVLDKVKVLLSSEHQTCLSGLLRGADTGGKHQSLDLHDLPVERLVQSMSRMPSTRSLLILEKGHIKSQECKSNEQPMHHVSSCLG